MFNIFKKKKLDNSNSIEIPKELRMSALMNILNNYKEATKEDCYKVILEQEGNVSILDSKIGGNYYIPISSDYPKDRYGNYMFLLVQINFSNYLFDIFPPEGILQIFVTKDYNEYKIKYYKDIKENYKTVFPNIDTSNFICKDSVKISFEKSISYMPVSDYRSSNLINQYVNNIINNPSDFEVFKQIIKFDYEEFYMSKFDYQNFLNNPDSVLYKLIESAIYYKIKNDYITIGGYADFTQSDPRENDELLSNKTECLFKIDDQEESFYLGDGIINILISTDDLQNQKFENSVLIQDNQ